MHTALIVAMARNRVIGRENSLPWRLSDDLKFFKRVTMGKPIIMGRKTWESIGRPLPGRRNIVITRNFEYFVDGIDVFHSLDEAISALQTEDEAMIIGGASLYKIGLEYASKLYLTDVNAEVEGDTYFPKFDLTDWQEIEREAYQKNEKNEFDFVCRTLIRK